MHPLDEQAEEMARVESIDRQVKALSECAASLCGLDKAEIVGVLASLAVLRGVGRDVILRIGGTNA